MEAAGNAAALNQRQNDVLMRRAAHRLNPKPPDKPKDPLMAPRPVGAPTTFEMVENVLEAAEKAGKDGLTGKELVDGIREKYWPGLQARQILPIIYGFVPERLHKTPGGKFKRKRA